MYKTVVIEYSPKTDNMAQKVEEKANEMLQEGYELITMSIRTGESFLRRQLRPTTVQPLRRRRMTAHIRKIWTNRTVQPQQPIG